MAPCAACYSRLATARHAMTESPDLASHVTAILGRPFDNSVAVLSIVELLHGAVGAIKEKAKVPLQGLKVACYYGCLLMRPPNVTRCDDAEAPTSMEAVVGATGATAVKWNMALECCGGGFSLSRTASVVRLSRAILEDAKRAGAEAIVVACPMCHSNLDFRQEAMARRGEPPMPILFITQLVGLALGVGDEALGLRRHFVDPRPFAEELRAAATGVPAALAGKTKNTAAAGDGEA
jgi:heterodisulfide reductase subunit B